jgi:hypothetical protein
MAYFSTTEIAVTFPTYVRHNMAYFSTTEIAVTFPTSFQAQ